MKFDKAEEVDQLCYQMRLADYKRGLNRARIDELFNGFPPYTQDEVEENGIAVNVNFLECTKLAHDARSQFYSAFLKPGQFFAARTDMGPKHKRGAHAKTVTNEVNRIMKRSLSYFECFRSKFALNVMHGVGPSAWDNRHCWCPDPMSMADVLIPANTLLTMKNLPFFAIYRSYTAPELIRLTRGPKVDPAWNLKLVDLCLEWIDRETMALMGSNWPEVWSPEKASERVKGDGGFYVGDQVPTIDVWDFYFWNDDDGQEGWRRRLILDSWSTPASMGGSFSRRGGEPFDSARGEFLFNSNARKYADRREELVAFQFADLSAVAPFRYHSVRSLGFLLFDVCHLQNRLRCKFSEAVFESLMMYFRVKTMDDAQRALKLVMANKGFWDESISPVPAAERYQINAALVEMGIQQNQQLIAEHSSAYTQQQNFSQDRVEKTKFQVMAEVNAMTSLTSSALIQAYEYQKFEFREIFRRFCIQDSKDPDVKEFRAACLRKKVPEKLLVADYWDIEPERVMGAGNKTLELTIAQQLMEWREKYDPDAQREILRDATMAITDDPARAALLVPEAPQVSDSIHDAQVAFGTLMIGAPVAPKNGLNVREVIEAWLVSMGLVCARIQQQDNMGTKEEILGLQNVAQHIDRQIKILSADPSEKQRVKQYGDTLNKLMNEVKGFAQRLQQKMQAAQAGGGGMKPEDQAKIQALTTMAKVKAQNARESHAQKTAQREITFQMKTRQEMDRHGVDIAKEDVKTAAEIHRGRLSSLSDRANKADAGRND